MVKILFFNPSGKIGGAEKSLLDLIININSQRYKPVLCITENAPLYDAVKNKGIEARVLDLPKPFLLLTRRWSIMGVITLLLSALLLPLIALRTGKIIKEESPGIVHTNGIKFHLICSFLKPFMNFRLVWHFRDLPAEGIWRWFIVKLAGIFPDRIIVNSDVVQQIFLDNQRAISKTRRVFNGIDTTKFVPEHPVEEIRKRLGFGEEFLVGMFSMFTEWKGHRILINAAERLARTFKEMRFLIVGGIIYDTVRDIGYRKKLETLTSEKKLNGIVSFLGRREDIADLMNAVDIVVNPTILPEPFGRVIIEAMALGKPVIVTEGGGLTEIVRKNRTGIVIPLGDEVALSGAIESLFRDKELCRQMGDNGRRLVQSKFSLKNYIEGVLDVYREMVA